MQNGYRSSETVGGLSQLSRTPYISGDTLVIQGLVGRLERSSEYSVSIRPLQYCRSEVRGSGLSLLNLEGLFPLGEPFLVPFAIIFPNRAQCGF